MLGIMEVSEVVAKNNFYIQRKRGINTVLSDDDTVTDALTANQLEQIKARLDALKIDYREAIEEEAKFYILSKGHLLSCGNNFSKRLKAVVEILRRGKWWSPNGLVIETTDNIPDESKILKEKLLSTYIRLNKLKGVLEEQTSNMQLTIHQTRTQILELEEQLIKKGHLKKLFNKI